jgi:hypothetical protein
VLSGGKKMALCVEGSWVVVYLLGEPNGHFGWSVLLGFGFDEAGNDGSEVVLDMVVDSSLRRGNSRVLLGWRLTLGMVRLWKVPA